MATLGNISTKLTRETGADTNTYPNAERAIDITSGLLRVQSVILDAQDGADYDDLNIGDYPIISTSMVANQRDYSIPQSEYVISISKVSVTYDGTNYYVATPVDSGETEFPNAPAGTTMETTIDSYYSKTAPVYDWRFGSIFIYPRASAADVTAGAKILLEVSREVQAFSSSDVSTGTLVPSIDSAFHPLLWLYPAFNYCNATGKTDRLPGIKAQIDVLEGLLRRQYGRKERDRKWVLTAKYKNYK